MELRRRTLTAAVRLATVMSVVAAAIAFAVAQLADVHHAIVVVPVIVIAFAASWIQTEWIRRRAIAELALARART